MLAVVAAAERRTAELAAAVDTVAQHTQGVSLGLAKQAAQLEGNTTATEKLGVCVQTATRAASAPGSRLNASAATLDESLSDHGRATTAPDRAHGGTRRRHASSNCEPRQTIGPWKVLAPKSERVLKVQSGHMERC